MIANDSTEQNGPPALSYWAESRRPLTSLFLAAPLLVVYELGLLCLGRDAVRNGAEAWLRYLLDLMGFSVYFLLPALTVASLLAWHHLLRQPWKVSHRVLAMMVVECLILAVGLWFVWRLQTSLWPSMSSDGANSISGSLADLRSNLGQLAGYCGAGVYEELLFRLILLSAVVALLRWLHLSPQESAIAGIILTSLLFSAAHHIGPWGARFDIVTFTFRTLAGVYFAVLFRVRGFGIAAGTHAFYDVLVGVFALLGSS